MAATWDIKTMDRDLSTGSVHVAHWRVTDTETSGDNTYTASRYGSCSFTPDSSSADFVLYADLTESVVLEWVFAEVNKDEIEVSLVAQISEQKNPTQSSGIPW